MSSIRPIDSSPSTLVNPTSPGVLVTIPPEVWMRIFSCSLNPAEGKVPGQERVCFSFHQYARSRETYELYLQKELQGRTTLKFQEINKYYTQHIEKYGEEYPLKKLFALAPRLTKLDFFGANLSNETLAKILEGVKDSGMQLKELHLGGNLHLTALPDLRDFPDLEILSLESCTEFNQRMDFSNSLKLRVLNLTNCDFNQPLDLPVNLEELLMDDCREFAHPLNFGPKIQKIILTRSDLFNHEVNLTNCQDLKVLQIRDCLLFNQSLDIRDCWQSLETLDLAWCATFNQEIIGISYCRLKKLDLFFCSAFTQRLRLYGCEKLESIDIRHCNQDLWVGLPNNPHPDLQVAGVMVV